MDKETKGEIFDSKLSINNSGPPPPEKNKSPGENSNLNNNLSNDKKLKTKKVKKKDFTPDDLDDLQLKLDKKEIGFFRNLATKKYTKKVSRDIIVERLISVGLVLILLTIGVVYSLSYTYVNSGYGINVIADQRITKAVSLSDDDTFERLSVGLKADAITQLDNISYTWLPPGLDNLGGGSHNGDNYIAYTFYVLNTGDANLEYESDLRIRYSTQNVETAMRVEIFTNGVPTVYTYTYEEQIDSLIEAEGVPVEEFESEFLIVHNVMNLTMGDYDRYTVVVWLEGEDYDCVNDKFSSELQMVWNISVIEDEEV